MKNPSFFLLTAFLTGFHFSLHSQSPSLDWALTIGGNGNERNVRHVYSPDGHLYVVGQFSDTIDVDPGMGLTELRSEGQDYFVLKLDTAGQLVWAGQITARSSDINGLTVSGLSIGPDGALLLSGTFQDTLDAHPGSGIMLLTAPPSVSSAFLIKVSPIGTLTWAKATRGEVLPAIQQSHVVGTDGSVYWAGTYQDTVDLDPGVGTAQRVAASTANGLFVSKLTANGDLVWTYAFDSISTGISAIARDQDDHVYVAGTFADSTDWDLGPGNAPLTSEGGFDGFVAKLNRDGQFQWAKSFRSSEDLIVFGITVGLAGDVFMAGQFRGAFDADPGPDTVALALPTQANLSTFIVKLSDDGSFRWAKRFEGPSPNSPRHILTDEAEQVYLTGFYVGVVDVDPGPDTAILDTGSSGSYLVCLDEAGELLWHRSVNQAVVPTESANLSLDDQFHLYVSGSFRDTFQVDSSPPILAQGGSDEFLMRLGLCRPTADTLIAQSCESSYQAPIGAILTSSGNYLDVIPNAGGCDSLITIELTLDSLQAAVDQAVTSDGAPLLFTSTTGSAYQWVDCNQQFAAIAGATSPTWVPSMAGDYAVVITSSSGCMDTSQCLPVLSVGLSAVSSGQVRAFPNPSEGVVWIQSDVGWKGADCSLHDAQGRMLWQRQGVSGEAFAVDMSAYPSGLYWLRWREGNRNGRLVIWR